MTAGSFDMAGLRPPKIKPQSYVGLHGGPTVNAVEDYDTILAALAEAEEDDERFIHVTGVMQDGTLARTIVHAPMIMWVTEAIE